MEQALDVLEKQIAGLRQAVREAVAGRDTGRVKELRAELRRAERAWDTLISPSDVDGETEGSEVHLGLGTAERVRPSTTSMLPVREQVHQALTLLGVPAAPKLIGAVQEAFFTGTLPSSRLASLRRDEERSYRSAPGARPYYLCPALTYDHLASARGLLTVSTWPLEDRIVGPLSSRVHFLTAAISIAEAVAKLGAGVGAGGDDSDGDESPAASLPTPAIPPAAGRLLRQFADNIPGATVIPTAAANLATAMATSRSSGNRVDPHLVRAAARAELDVHADADRDTRTATARRARRQLDDAEQLFGTRLKSIRGAVGRR